MIYILFTALMMVFTVLCFRRYIHPGTHKGFMDQNNNYSWVPFKEKWFDTTDVPVNVSSLLAQLTRAWFWFVTGLNIKEWASVHRHNSMYEHDVYPNGKPGIIGRAKVFLTQKKNKDLINSYSIETPNLILDRLYQKFPYLGPIIFLLILVLLFGPVGIFMWSAQMAWLPFWFSESANGWILKSFEKNRLMDQLIDKEFFK
jgi:hypothetical protein